MTALLANVLTEQTIPTSISYTLRILLDAVSNQNLASAQPLCSIAAQFYGSPLALTVLIQVGRSIDRSRHDRETSLWTRESMSPSFHLVLQYTFEPLPCYPYDCI